MTENKEINIDLFYGDIFDLNFLRKDAHRKALVNATYTSACFHTPLSMRLESLSGEKLGHILIKNNHKKIKRGDIISGKPGKLNFDVIFYCPVYDVNTRQRKDPFLKYIDTTIKNLFEHCDRENIDTLIVPAIGSYWGEQERHKVAVNIRLAYSYLNFSIYS